MKLPRRQFLHLAAGAVALPVASRFAWAYDDPSRPTRIVVGFAPGSSADIVARLLSQSLSESLGRTFIVDNQPGAGGNLATEIVVRAEPDGRTLLLAGPSNAINATLYEKLAFDFARDITPVAAAIRAPNVMLLNRSLPVRTVTEFIAFAKAHPGKLNLASAGVGTASHLAGELFEMMAGIEMVHVPSRGGGAAAYAGLLDGSTHVYVPALASAIDHLKNPQLRALATTTHQPQRLLNVPTVGHVVPGYETSTWFGIGAPRNTPAAIVDTLNRAINAALADPKVAARVADLGGTVIAGSPGDFGTLIADETSRWAKVIRSSGATWS